MKKDKNFIGLTIVLILIITFSITATAQGAQKRAGRIEKNYLAQVEKEYRKEVRSILNAQGYQTTGITMTKITQENGMLEYTVKINHKAFTRLSNEKKESLRAAIGEITFIEKNSKFFYEFL